MKKIGVLFIVTGALIMIGGIVLLQNASFTDNSSIGEFAKELDSDYGVGNGMSRASCFAISGIGLILLIVGIVMASSKSSIQRNKEAELLVLKNSNSAPSVAEKKSENNIDDRIFSQLEKLAKLKDQGIITDDEFQQQKKKLL